MLFFICLPLIAFLYAAVGHGGASGYLALMSIFSFQFLDHNKGTVGSWEIKSIALTLNLFVAGIAFYQYYRAGHFNKKLFIPLACASIPMAFLGGRMEIDTQIYFYTLAIFLLFASFKLFFSKSIKENINLKNINLPIALLAGATIGFISGLLGIGGGIILSPILILLAWSNAKTTAGISALFIFVNSAAGLFGQASQFGLSYPISMPWIILLVIVGGLIGAYFGVKRLSPIRIKQALAFVLLLAALKIFVS